MAPSEVVSHYILPHLYTPLSLSLTSGLRAADSLRGILMSLSRLPACVSTSVFLSLSLVHIYVSVNLLLFALLLSHIQDGPQLSFGILSHNHHLPECHLSPTLRHSPHPSTYGTYPPQPNTHPSLLMSVSLNSDRKYPKETLSNNNSIIFFHYLFTSTNIFS